MISLRACVNGYDYDNLCTITISSLSILIQLGHRLNMRWEGLLSYIVDFRADSITAELCLSNHLISILLLSTYLTSTMRQCLPFVIRSDSTESSKVFLRLDIDNSNAERALQNR